VKAPGQFRSLQGIPPELELNTASLQPVCQAIQDNFMVKSNGTQGEGRESSVTCVCTGSTTASFAIACEFNDAVCSPLGTVCGRPFIGMSVERYSLFSVTACVYDYNRRGVRLNDTCVGLEVCPSDEYAVVGDGSSPLGSVRFCGCMAQYGTQVCPKCEACDSGRGIFLDCSEYNAEVVTPQCRSPDVDLDWSGATGSVAGFIPNLDGMCTKIESALNNRVVCDCTDTGGGNFNLSCELSDQYCTDEAESGMRYCGSMKSTAQFRDGEMASVTSCSDFSSPADLLQTCVTFDVADPSKNATTGGVWSGCQASYGGQNCRSCGLCEADAVTMEGEIAHRPMGVTLDCTNVGPEWATVQICQPLEKSLGVLEFIPRFVNVPSRAQSESSGSLSRRMHQDASRNLLETTSTALLVAVVSFYAAS
jgi:hypothetical protein